MITIKEIADQLGVSATTVSNVLNGRAGKMSQETRQRVEEALLRNHYVKEKKNNSGEPQHHLIAVYICLGKKKHVLTDPFCGGLLEGIDRELLDEIVDLLVETVCSARTTIRIAGDDYPAELVKSKLMKLNSSHIEFVFDCISKNTTEIRNIKKYLLAVLFNAPSTINGYYTALVAHDMNTGKI